MSIVAHVPLVSNFYYDTPNPEHFEQKKLNERAIRVIAGYDVGYVGIVVC